jgi:hypothetical protein
MTTARPSPAPIAKMPWHKPVIRDITSNRLPWHRPKIVDITHEYYRPNAEQVDARHREVTKHWQRQRQRRSEETPEAPEDLRLAHLRWRELQRLLRYRYGVVMPDTFEARRDLEIVIGYAILTKHKPQHVAELLAPWLDEAELDHLAAHQHPVLHKADDIAHKLNLRYCDRQALAIILLLRPCFSADKETQCLCGFLIGQIQVVPINAAQLNGTLSTAAALIARANRHVATTPSSMTAKIATVRKCC